MIHYMVQMNIQYTMYIIHVIYVATNINILFASINRINKREKGRPVNEPALLATKDIHPIPISERNIQQIFYVYIKATKSNQESGAVKFGEKKTVCMVDGSR